METVKKVWSYASPVVALVAGIGLVVVLERRGGKEPFTPTPR